MDPALLQIILQILMLSLDEGPEEEAEGVAGLALGQRRLAAVSRPSVRPAMPPQHVTGGMSRMMV